MPLPLANSCKHALKDRGICRTDRQLIQRQIAIDEREHFLENENERRKINCTIEFETKTHRKHITNSLKHQCYTGLTNVDQLLQERRNRLKCLLLEDEQIIEEERKLLAEVRVKDEKWKMMKEEAESLKHSRELTHRAIVEEKLDEHFRLNNPDMRAYYSTQLTLEAAKAQRIQIEQHEMRKKQEKATRENLIHWGDGVGQVPLLQETIEEKRKQNEQEKTFQHYESLKYQILEHKIAAENAKLLKEQEAIQAKVLAKMAKEEELRELERKQKEKFELHKIMYAQMESSLKQKQRKKILEKELDNVYAQLSEDDQERVHQEKLESKTRTNQAVLHDLNISLRLKSFSEQENKEADKKFEIEAKKINDEQMQLLQQQARARNKLMKEVFEEREQQIIDKQKLLMHEKILEERESKYAEIHAREEEAKLASVQKMAKAKHREQSAILREQIEYNNELKKQQKLEEAKFCLYEETQLKMDKQRFDKLKVKLRESSLHPFHKTLKK